MQNRMSAPWRILAVVMVLALTSMACQLSVDAPQIPRPDIQIPDILQATQQPAQPADQNGDQTNPAQDPGQPSQQGENIPETGRDPGELADPVTQAPENLEAAI